MGYINKESDSLYVRHLEKRIRNKVKEREDRVERKKRSIEKYLVGFPELKVERRPSLNAVKSGLFAKSPFIKTPFYEESKEDFNSVLQGLRSTFAPQGAFEEDLVERLARDLHSRKRGELFENYTVRHNELEQIHAIEEDIGIRAIKEQIETASAHLQKCKDVVAELSRVPEDIVQTAKSDFGKHRAAFMLIYDELWQSGSLARQMALERARKLGRFHIVLGEEGLVKAPAIEILRAIVQKKNQALQEAEATLGRLSSQLKVKEEQLIERMSQDSVRCLLPSIQDLESLNRFYSMHDRKIAKTIDLLMKVQFVRLNGQGVIAMKSLPRNGNGKSIVKSQSEHDNESSLPSVSETTNEGEDNE